MFHFHYWNWMWNSGSAPKTIPYEHAHHLNTNSAFTKHAQMRVLLPLPTRVPNPFYMGILKLSRPAVFP